MDLFKKQIELRNYSNFKVARLKAKLYLGSNAELLISTRKDKKYMIKNPKTDKMVHFGAMGYEDYTKHLDDNRRELYIKRASNIKGDWKEDPYSSNNLAIHILW